MLRDLDALAGDAFDGREYDVCIVGAGFAGISLALALPRQLRVLLLEGGGLEYRSESQEIYQGSIVGHEYIPLDATRLRQFGGTSSWWGGWTLPLRDWDFAARPKFSMTGWPIDKVELDPYTSRTWDILDIDANTNVQWGDALAGLDGLERFDFHWSRPATQMGRKYRADIEARDNLDCVVNANLTDLSLSEDGARVDGMEVRDYAGRRFRPRATRVVLAVGGIETPRLLLNFDRQQRGGIGNANGWVGRSFMEHPHYDVGWFVLKESLNRQLAARHEPSAPLVTAYLQPTAEFMRASGGFGFGLRVIHWGKTPSGSLQSRLHCLMRQARQPAHPQGGGESECELDGLIRIESEQAPNPESRLFLNADTDRFGMRRVSLDWRITPQDKYTMRRAVRKLGEEFARHDIGRVRMTDWLFYEHEAVPGAPEEIGGNHHIGTTRMAKSARDGVVDRNLKVFGVDNLYLCGSSVFTTAGNANPTYTIVQLALRLADHLALASAHYTTRGCVTGSGSRAPG